MTKELARDKRDTSTRALLGALLILGGFVLRSPLSVVMAVSGAWLLGRALTRLIRIRAATQNIEWQRSSAEFQRATLPRQIFMLLLAVAEVDGRAEAAERRMVAEFLLTRFGGPVTATDLRSWEAQRIPSGQLGNLASALRRTLTPAERETVFYWSCQITFADRRFRSDEHAALRTIAKGLGIRPTHARVIFHHAKARFLAQDEAPGGNQSDGPTWGRTQRPSTNPQRRALDVLGLDDKATPLDIRARHRELVKRYHPDAHVHLGPVAAEEAAARFREIQAAYELLGGGR